MTQAPTAEMEPMVESMDAPETPTPPKAAVEVKPVELPEAFDTGARVPGGQLDILMETEVEITANLGDAQLPAREVLQLGPGAVVTLNKQTGEPVDLIMNGVRFATGNLVVVGDQLGIRIREVLAPPAGGQTVQ